jgi:Trypsin-co-occurring domain 1
MAEQVITDRYHVYARPCGWLAMEDCGERGVCSHLAAAPLAFGSAKREKMCVMVCRRSWGCGMAEFVRFTLDDGSEVLFESAESDLVTLHGGQLDVVPGGKLTARLQGVAEAAEEVAGSLRSRLAPDEVSLEFGLKVSGGVNWFFAKAQGEGTIKVTLKWAGAAAAAEQHETEPDPGRG